MFGFLIIFLFTGLVVALVGGLLYYNWKPAGATGSVVGLTRIVAIVGLILLGAANLWAVIAILLGVEVEVTVPIQPFWPDHPNVTILEPVRGDSVSSVITEVHVTSSALSLTTRILLATGSLLQGSSVIAVLIAVIVLCNGLRAGHPFTQSLPRTGRITAVVIILGSLLGQILDGIAASRAGEESLTVSAWSSEGLLSDFEMPWPIPTWSVDVDFGLFFVALGIMVVVELVTAGIKLGEEHRKLQSDTDGLV